MWSKSRVTNVRPVGSGPGGWLAPPCRGQASGTPATAAGRRERPHGATGGPCAGAAAPQLLPWVGCLWTPVWSQASVGLTLSPAGGGGWSGGGAGGPGAGVGVAR